MNTPWSTYYSKIDRVLLPEIAGVFPLCWSLEQIYAMYTYMPCTACIVLNSPTVCQHALALHTSKADLIIVADGAVRHIPDGIKPHVICGDFDSLDRVSDEKRFPYAEFVHDSCQETNDLDKCIRLAMHRAVDEVTVVGSLDGRFDHALGILSVLERYHRSISISLYDGTMMCRVLSRGETEEGEYVYEVGIGDTVSLIPRGDGTTVSIKGVQWSLKEERLTAGSRGISNKATSNRVSVTIHDGVVFFCHGPQQMMLDPHIS